MSRSRCTRTAFGGGKLSLKPQGVAEKVAGGHAELTFVRCLDVGLGWVSNSRAERKEAVCAGFIRLV